MDILIDDYIGNIDFFIRNGPRGRNAILFAQPWNQDITPIGDLITSGTVRIAHSWKAVSAILGDLSDAKSLQSGQGTQPESKEVIRKEYLMSQAIICFFAGFLFLRGYSLSGEVVRPVFSMPGWTYITLSLIFLVLCFVLAMATFSRWLLVAVERLMRVATFPIGVASLGGFVSGWLSGLEGLHGQSLLFRVFFFAGLTFFLIVVLHFIRSSWSHGRMWRTKL